MWRHRGWELSYDVHLYVRDQAAIERLLALITCPGVPSTVSGIVVWLWRSYRPKSRWLEAGMQWVNKEQGMPAAPVAVTRIKLGTYWSSVFLYSDQNSTTYCALMRCYRCTANVNQRKIPTGSASERFFQIHTWLMRKTESYNRSTEHL